MTHEISEKVEGQWMNLVEIRSLGATWSEQELNEILVYGFNPVPSREKEYIDEKSGQSRKIAEYFIDPVLRQIFLPYN